MFKQSVPICFYLLFTILHFPLCLLFIKRKCFETHQKILYSIFLLFNIFQILLTWLCSLVVMLSGPPPNLLLEPQYVSVRSSHWRCSVRKGVLINYAKFTGKRLRQSLFFNKVAGRPATLLKRGSSTGVFL